MQSDQQYFPLKPGLPLADQVGNGYMHNAPISSFFGELSPSVKHLPPFQNVDFQPSKVCPRNFIIFDQTHNRSQIMYHPATAPKFCYPGLNGSAPYFQDSVKRNDVNDERETPSSLKEDSADIDALLNMEEEEEEEYDEEEVSTARTNGDYASDTADSCSSKPRKSRLLPLSSSSHKSTGIGSSSRSERKHQKMRKMVKALRGIVPGGNQMNTVAVLDEAVRYLKSLKVEVQKIGLEIVPGGNHCD